MTTLSNHQNPTTYWLLTIFFSEQFLISNLLQTYNNKSQQTRIKILIQAVEQLYMVYVEKIDYHNPTDTDLIPSIHTQVVELGWATGVPATAWVHFYDLWILFAINIHQIISHSVIAIGKRSSSVPIYWRLARVRHSRCWRDALSEISVNNRISSVDRLVTVTIQSHWVSGVSNRLASVRHWVAWPGIACLISRRVPIGSLGAVAADLMGAHWVAVASQRVH
jgi:hypothetical protein